jgi:C4-dicarboxylate transporter DctM subunit
MDPFIFALVSFGAILALIAIGVPVAFSVFTVAAAGMYFAVGDAFLMSMVKGLVYASSSNYSFAVIPMFVLMGEIAGKSGIITDLYQACYRWVGALRGGVYNATVLASTGFAAISGSTVVNAAVFTRVALPEIERYGLNKGFGAGCIAASGTLAAMIPPSLTMVLYGILTEESIGKLLVAGILPGLLTACVLMLTVWVSALLRKDLTPVHKVRFTRREKLAGLRDVWPALLLALIIMSGIYSGTVSPSAAGTIGVAGALIIGLMKRRMTWALFADALRRSVVISAALFVIVIAGLLFSRLLLVTGSVGGMTDLISSTGLGAAGFIGMIVLVYFILGMFIDPVSLMIMTVPFLFPTAKAMGIDGIWLGIIVVKLVEIAAITPPIGINLFAVMSASEGKLATREIFVGVLPFVVAELVVLSMLLMWPQISTFLPNSMVQ